MGAAAAAAAAAAAGGEVGAVGGRQRMRMGQWCKLRASLQMVSLGVFCL